MKVRLALAAVVVVLAAWVIVEMTLIFAGQTLPEPLYSSWGYWTVIAASALVVIIATWHAKDRLGWWWIAAGLGCWLVGDVVFELGGYGAMDDPPLPNPSDAAYLLFCPAIWVGLAFLQRAPAGRRWQHLLDGASVSWASTALICAALFPLPLEASGLEFLTLISYPLADALLLGVVVSGLAMRGWRRNVGATTVAGGLALFAVADVVYAQQSAAGTFVSPSLVDSVDGWVRPSRARRSAAGCRTRDSGPGQSPAHPGSDHFRRPCARRRCRGAFAALRCLRDHFRGGCTGHGARYARRDPARERCAHRARLG